MFSSDIFFIERRNKNMIKHIHIQIEPDLKKKFKIAVAKEGKTEKDIIAVLIVNYLKGK